MGNKQIVSGNGNEVNENKTVNNNYGLSVSDACEIAKALFEENFPVLQKAAMEEADKRVDELIDSLKQKMASEKNVDATPFRDPGVQYMITKAEIEYARYGNPSRLNYLCDLVVERLKVNTSDPLAVSIDLAIELINKLNDRQLNLLSLIFVCKHAKNEGIENSVELAEEYNRLYELLPCDLNKDFSYLLSLNLMVLSLDSLQNRAKEIYGFEPDSNILNKDVANNIHGDYGLNYVGIVLAIINLNIKTNSKCELTEFIY